MNEGYTAVHLTRSTVRVPILQDIRGFIRRLIELLEFTQPRMNLRASRREALRKLLDS